MFSCRFKVPIAVWALLSGQGAPAPLASVWGLSYKHLPSLLLTLPQQNSVLLPRHSPSSHPTLAGPLARTHAVLFFSHQKLSHIISSSVQLILTSWTTGCLDRLLLLNISAVLCTVYMPSPSRARNMPFILEKCMTQSPTHRGCWEPQASALTLYHANPMVLHSKLVNCRSFWLSYVYKQCLVRNQFQVRVYSELMHLPDFLFFLKE